VNPGLGRVILLGAPLGNIEDASPRLRAALETADVIAAEDTRRLHRLARDLGLTLSARIVSYFEGNDDRRTPEP
jgi:16S rRNA (cytidine1402-2'-O)-methyltransferase